MSPAPTCHNVFPSMFILAVGTPNGSGFEPRVLCVGSKPLVAGGAGGAVFWPFHPRVGTHKETILSCWHREITSSRQKYRCAKSRMLMCL